MSKNKILISIQKLNKISSFIIEIKQVFTLAKYHILLSGKLMEGQIDIIDKIILPNGSEYDVITGHYGQKEPTPIGPICLSTMTELSLDEIDYCKTLVGKIIERKSAF